MSTEKTTNYVSFIWKIANLLRGDYKEHEYGDVILPFTVLTRLDSVLAGTKDKVAQIRDQKGVPAEVKRLQYAKATGYPFWNTSKFTLHTLKNDPDNLEGNLTAYVQAFSPNARDVMQSYSFFNVIDRLDRSGLLFQILDAFTAPDVDLSPKAVSNADMGTIFEELIRRFNELSNETAGEHFTPREVINLMVNILFEPDMDVICEPGFMASLYDPGAGTGGMLSTAIEQAHDLNDRARIEVYGQELNPQTYAVAKSDTLIKGEDADRIYFGNSLTDDKTAGRTFNYMLCNPPFGVEWKKYADPIKEEAEKRGWNGRFGSGLPRISDGSFLFLQHMISKMKPYNPNDTQKSPGTRIAIVFNGSPLFTGAAGSGESNIRRWILENDWLEAIIALPDQMFYNTGILTYIWVLSNRKEPRRKNKVQLIDATGFFDRMRKPLGEKRKYLTEDNIADIAQIYGSFTEGEHSKIFDTTEFGFREVTVERPLRLNFQVSPERIERLWEQTTFKNLASSKKRSEPARSAEIQAGKNAQIAIVSALDSLDGEVMWKNRDEFTKVLKAAFKELGLTVRAPLLKAILAALGETDPSADICYGAKGNVEPDPALRDTEQVPLAEDIDAYVQREIIPYAADAYVDPDKTKIGYEIPFTRYFYQYEELGDPTETLAEIQTLGADIQAAIAKLFSEQCKRELIAHTVTKGLNPDAPMKDSGIDWIGKIPNHWHSRSLKSLLTRKSRKGEPSWRVLSVERERGVVDRELEGSPDNNNRLPDDLSGYLVVRNGQFVMNKMKAWQGSYGVSLYDGIVSPAYYTFDLASSVDSEFFNWAIRSKAYIPFFGRDSYGIRTDQWDFKVQALRNIPLFVPPVEEQRQIVDYLVQRLKGIDGLITDLDRQVELLRRYRKQVINDVVTGKIRVSEEA